jgi:hypothetical protein
MAIGSPLALLANAFTGFGSGRSSAGWSGISAHRNVSTFPLSGIVRPHEAGLNLLFFNH